MLDDKIIREDATVIAKANIDWSRFQNKTVFVAGANGYVPQFFIHGFLMRNILFGENIHIIALCRNEKKAHERFGKYMNRDDFSLIIGDVKNEVVIDREVDYIIHAASPAGVKNSNNNPIETFEANVIGCSNLLKLAKQKKAELLYLSSIDIYGETGENRFVEERTGILDPMDIRNVYAVAKRAAENLCICYSKENVISKIVRPSQIMGGGIDLNDGRLHIDFISQILKDGRIVLKGDGTPIRTFIYITDAIIGMLYVMTEGKSGEAYNICSEQGESSVLGLAKIMVEQIKNEKVAISYNMDTRKTDLAVKHASHKVCGCSSKLRALGWKPMVSLEQACLRMMEYYGVKI